MPDEILRPPVAVRPQALQEQEQRQLMLKRSQADLLLTGVRRPADPEEKTNKMADTVTEDKNRNNSGNGATKCSFQVLNKIGQGGYGTVYTVEKNEGIDKNIVYALKVRKKL